MRFAMPFPQGQGTSGLYSDKDRRKMKVFRSPSQSQAYSYRGKVYSDYAVESAAAILVVQQISEQTLAGDK
jgi:hypothetical protein